MLLIERDVCQSLYWRGYVLQFVFVLCQIQLLRKWDIRSINEMLTVEKATMSSNTPELCKWKLWQLHSCLVDADVVLLMF